MAAVVFAVNHGITLGLEHVADAVMIENLGLDFETSSLDEKSQRQPLGGHELTSQPTSLLEVIRN